MSAPEPEEPAGPATTGAESMIATFLACGIDTMFANPGTTEMNTVAALDTEHGKGMRAVLGLHENVVTGAADGYARMSGKPAATLLHLGVGLANGIANLHNARRACSPVVNVIGDMATWHQSADALLTMDIKKLAETVSVYVRTPLTPSHVAVDTASAVEATRDYHAGASRVSTLILPHDVQRENVVPDMFQVRLPAPALQKPRTDAEGDSAFERGMKVDDAYFGAQGRMKDMMDRAATMLSEHGPKAALYVGGAGLFAAEGPSSGDTPGGLEAAGRCTEATGSTLLCENAFARVDRGEGLPKMTRVPYFPPEAKKEIQSYDAIVFIGARVPVAMFGYEDGTSALVDKDKQDLLCVDTHDPSGALHYLDHLLALKAGDKPEAKPARSRPKSRLPRGKLTAQKLCQAVAAMQPAGAIIVDESLTSGTAYWGASQNCAPFSQLTLTGGAIGQGPPLAVGAAVACPSRRVINIQADGSGLYTCQALWTQAREKLPITTVVCANRTYNILKIEQDKQKLERKGASAESLTYLGNPDISWASIGAGFGVESVTVDTAEGLLDALRKSPACDPKRTAPFLIECLI